MVDKEVVKAIKHESFGDIDKALDKILGALKDVKDQIAISNGYLKTLSEK